MHRAASKQSEFFGEEGEQSCQLPYFWYKTKFYKGRTFASEMDE